VSSTAVLTQHIDPTKTENLFVSGSDDRFALVFDVRTKNSVATLSCKYPVLAVAMGESEIYTSGVDDVIKVWDTRTGTISYTLPGHTDTVTGLKLNSDGTSLLSCSMDNTLRTWDVRPFPPTQGGDSARCIKEFKHAVVYGPDKNLLRCAWSPDSSRISSGCSDTPTHVHIWDSRNGSLLYKLPGHRGTVNEVDFHPLEPIVASASSDHAVFLGEIAPQ
jgi:Prp8 binding protein